MENIKNTAAQSKKQDNTIGTAKQWEKLGSTQIEKNKQTKNITSFIYLPYVLWPSLTRRDQKEHSKSIKFHIKFTNQWINECDWRHFSCVTQAWDKT